MECVKLEKQEKIAVLTIDRPKCLNALNNQVYHELSQSLREIAADRSVKAVILTGAGDKAFAAGADIAQMVHQGPQEARELSQLCHEVSDLLENIPQVTIAAVNGFALGGGCELTLACDLRIVSQRARFGLPEVGLGIFPAAGGTQRLARIAGVGRAKELIFTGSQIDAEEAYRIGIANHVVPHESLMDEAMTLAKRIADNGSYAVALAKSAINSSMSVDLPTGMAREEDLFGLVFATHDKQEGMEAFLERRKPVFTD